MSDRNDNKVSRSQHRIKGNEDKNLNSSSFGKEEDDDRRNKEDGNNGSLEIGLKI